MLRFGPSSDAASGGGYAVPKLPPPTPPTAPTPVASPYAALTPAQILAQANQQAQNAIDPQAQAIKDAQAAADAQAQRQYEAIKGYNAAAEQLLAGMDFQKPYQDAAAATSGYGNAVGGQVSADLAKEQQAADVFAAWQGQSGGQTIDPSKVGQTIGFTEGYVPSASLEAQGAAAADEGKGLSAIQIAVGRGQLDQAFAAAKQQDDTYAQQLIALCRAGPRRCATRRSRISSSTRSTRRTTARASS